jgi:hypothetical protein
MSGVLGILLGSGGASRYQMAVGQYSAGFKGIWWTYYGFGIANAYYPIGGVLSPTTFKGQTIQGIYSVEDNVGSTWPVTLQLQGDQPAGFASAVTVGGTMYSFDIWAQDYGASLTVTINIATATFTMSSTSGITNGTPVQFTTGGTLPSGLVASTKYYARDVAATTFKVSAMPGGAAITLAGSQSGGHTVYFAIYTRFSADTPTPSNKTGARIPFYPTITIASPTTITSTGHGLTNGRRMLFQTSGALPSGIAANTIYFVVNAATNTFQVSATSGGAAIGTSGTQSGSHTCFEVVDVTLE